MRFISVAVQAFGIRKDGVGEVVVFVDEEIHFLSGTFAGLIEVVQLLYGPIHLAYFFQSLRWQKVGISLAEVHESNAAMCIQSLSIIVQFAGDT